MVKILETARFHQSKPLVNKNPYGDENPILYPKILLYHVYESVYSEQEDIFTIKGQDRLIRDIV